MIFKNIKKHFFLKIFIPVIVFIMRVNTIFGLFKNPKREIIEVKKPISISEFVHSVSGLGVTEPQSEIINIGTNISGIVSEVYVRAGDKIKKSDIDSLYSKIKKANA